MIIKRNAVETIITRYWEVIADIQMRGRLYLTKSYFVKQKQIQKAKTHAQTTQVPSHLSKRLKNSATKTVIEMCKLLEPSKKNLEKH